MNVVTITLDLSKSGGKERVRIGRWDRDGTTVSATINDGGKPVDLDGMDVAMIMRLSDGSVLELPCDTDESVATATLDESDVGDCSVTIAYVRVVDGERTYSTDRFKVDILAGRESA